MKVLWLSNVILPDVAENEGLPVNIYGGWVTGLFNELRLMNKFNFCFVAPFKKKRHGITKHMHQYYLFKTREAHKYIYGLQRYFVKILKKENPDIIHIFGSEFPHALIMAEAAKKVGLADRVLLNLQGIIGLYALSFFDGLPKNIINKYTLRDLIKNDNIYQQKMKYLRRGMYEFKALRAISHVSGRTGWDRAAASAINPNIEYHFANEILRDNFYSSKKWSYEECQKYTIFMSQSAHPIKGLHFALEALNILKNDFDVHLRVAGTPLINNKSAHRQTYYAIYIKELIDEYNLSKYITFTGELNANEMHDEYLKAHVAICPSSIENSPNSMQEAGLLGVPRVAAEVGGTSSIIVHNQTGFLYIHDEPDMLADYIKDIFTNEELAKKMSIESIKDTSKLTDKKANSMAIVSAYEKIINMSGKI